MVLLSCHAAFNPPMGKLGNVIFKKGGESFQVATPKNIKGNKGIIIYIHYTEDSKKPIDMQTATL